MKRRVVITSYSIHYTKLYDILCLLIADQPTLALLGKDLLRHLNITPNLPSQGIYPVKGYLPPEMTEEIDFQRPPVNIRIKIKNMRFRHQARIPEGRIIADVVV